MAQSSEIFGVGLRPTPGTGYGPAVTELLRTNDPVLISFAEALMREAGIPYQVVDQNMSVMEGTIGILPRRVLVDRNRLEDARRILAKAGLERELS